MTAKDPFNGLTEKQLDVVSCLMFGLPYKAIGKMLSISDRTVEGHVREIVQKSNLVSKDEIIRRIRLPENTDYYKELETRYKQIVSSINPPKSALKISWKTYFIISITLLMLGVVIYSILRENTETYLQSIKNSTYLLSRRNIIEQMTSCKNQVIVLTGQGGAGKTTIARKYISDLNKTIKYEINAESKSSIKSELMGLAGVLAKTPKDIETKNIIESISSEKEKFRHLSIFLQNNLKKEKNWCLLLDNLDDPNIVSSVYLDNLFNLSNGIVVITTRNKNVGSYFPDTKVIRVSKLSEKEKIKLFCKITRQNPSKTIEKNLLEIPSYPLDVSCCAHYIKNTGISLSAYIQKMNQMDLDFWNGNKKILTDSVNYNESRCSIIASSIENILQHDVNYKKAKALLAVSILDSQKIPLDLLTKVIKEKSSDESIYEIQKYGLIDLGEDKNFSTHRVTQIIMRHYCFQHIPQNILNKFISEICETISEDKSNESLIPHIKSIISNLEDRLSLRSKIKMQIALAYLIQQYGRSPIEAVKYIKQVIQTAKNILNPYRIVELQLEGAKLCISSGQNEDAIDFLNNDLEKLPFNKDHLFSYIHYYTLLGIIHMRSRHPIEANENFDKAIKFLAKIKGDSDKQKLAKAAIYSEKGINYIMCYIYKHKKYEIIKLLKHVIDLIKGIDTPESNNILANTEVGLATMYNSLGMHDKAVQVCNEAENLLKKIKKNNHFYSIKGLIYLDRGHAALRENNLSKAKLCLCSAKKIFDQLMLHEYFSRVRVQEAEVLARTGEYDEAYQDCMDIITSGKTDNDFNELFLNRAHYIAGDIQYKLQNYQQALKHFRDFTIGSKKFCKHFLSEQQYEELERMHAFDIITDKSDIKNCFKNAIEIFKRICCQGSKFITGYVQKNFENI